MFPSFCAVDPIVPPAFVAISPTLVFVVRVFPVSIFTVEPFAPTNTAVEATVPFVTVWFSFKLAVTPPVV